jgi:signal transduction histidine kinase
MSTFTEPSGLNRERLLHRIVNRIQQSLELREILNETVAEVQAFLSTDRVKIYRFFPDGSGEVIAESIQGDRLPSLLGQHFPPDHIPPHPRELFMKARQREIVDTLKQVGVSPSTEVGQTESPHEILPCPVDFCHADYLKAMGVNSSVAVPLLYQEKLWGLLVSHHAEPRTVNPQELEFLQMVADYVSVAIAQSILLTQAREQVQHHQFAQQLRTLNHTLEQRVEERAIALQHATEQQKALAQVIAKIRATLDLDLIFNTATHEMRQLLNSDRVAIFRFIVQSEFEKGEFVSESVLPDFPSLLQETVDEHCFKSQYAVRYQKGRIQAISDIHAAKLKDCYKQLLSRFGIRANLIVPVLQGEELWGLLCVHQCSAPRHWKPDEIEFAHQIATQLGIALQQAELLAQTQQQAEQLRQAFHKLQQAQTQLIHTEKMSSLGQLVAGVAHEINNPVNFIYGNLNHATEYTLDLLDILQLYQQYYPNPVEEIRDHAETIDLEFLSNDLPKILASMKTGADRIRQIVLSLRNFSRFDQTEMKAVDIHEGIDSTLMILQYRMKAKPEHAGIEIIKEYGELPPVECYAGQLNQVFMNVLSNAIDALEEIAGQTKTPLAIRIHTSLRQISSKLTHVVIQIADNGPGIPEEIRAHIFDPFFTTKPIGQGTGLGLSISNQIVTERHGGVFKCTSQPGQGTEFRIEIPLQQTAQLVQAGIAD